VKANVLLNVNIAKHIIITQLKSKMWTNKEFENKIKLKYYKEISNTR
jgi:hypothetical protein